ncbi:MULTISPECIES: RHS repeat-associated core domain-containing protein [Streptomyces]|nr:MULTISPECIES: RHS repeat-associated core domain-containing protein [Streptomyces]
MDRDPTPGDPDEVRELADELREFADDVGEALGKIRGLASERAVLDWAGLSADAFRREFEGVPDNLTKLEDSYSLCAQALHGYWPKLQTAQGMADRALDRAISAQADLASAQSALGDAQDWVGRAGDEAERLQREGERENVEPPDEADVRAAARDQQAAEAAAGAAQGRVDDAEERLAAARQLALDAQEMREEAARECARDIDEASDAGIQNRRWWEKAIKWVTDNWDTLVDICKVIVAVLGVVVMIIGGPLAWVVLAAALVVLADTLVKYARGEAGLLDVAFAALDCIPGMKGLTTLGGLAAGLRGLARGGLRGIANGAAGLARNARGAIGDGVTGAFDRLRNVVRSGGTDPIDLATGAMFLSQTDLRLGGALPLVISRRVASDYHTGRWFGPSWASTCDQRIEVDEQGLVLVDQDGLLLSYPHPAESGDEVWPERGPRWPLTVEPDGGYTVSDLLTGQARRFRPPDESRIALLERLSDRNGNQVTFHYDATGAPTDIRHSGGYHLRLTTEECRITRLSLMTPDSPESEITVCEYGYDRGNLTEVIGSLGRPLEFAYDERLRITSWTDTNGHGYHYTYDARDRCVGEQGDAGELAVTIAYDGSLPEWPEAARVTTLTTAEGAVSHFVVNDLCQVVAEIDPLGGVTRRDHDANHQVVAHTDQLGHTTRITRNLVGQPIEVTYADGTTTRYTYGAHHRPISIVLADGTAWTWEFDERANCVAVIDGTGATWRYAFDQQGRLTHLIDPLGATTRVVCDATGQPVQLTDPLGNRVAKERDAFGRVVRITDPLGAVTRLEWTVEGLIRTAVAPDGGIRRWDYDGEGNCVAQTDAGGATTHFEYGPFDRLSARIEPDGRRYEFTHDEALRLVAVTDPRGLVWEYSYDSAGRLLAEKDFDDRRVEYRRDTAGRMAARVNAVGQVVGYAYDPRGQLVEKTVDRPTGDQPDHLDDPARYSFTYNVRGQMATATGPDAKITWERDGAGQPLSETLHTGEVARRTTYRYRPDGRRVLRKTPGGAVTTYGYDAAGRRTSMDIDGHRMVFEHDAAGRQTLRTADDFLGFGQEWDEAGRLVARSITVPGEPTLRHSYEYGADGQLLSVDEADHGRTTFRRDASGRICEVSARGWSESYAYDEAGNQTRAAWPDRHPLGDARGDREYTGNRLVRAGAVRYEYDAAGRVVTRMRTRLSRKPDIWRYSWDAEDRLTAVVTPDGTRWRYGYDPLGRRVFKERLGVERTTSVTGAAVDACVPGAERAVRVRTRVVERVDFTWDGSILVEQVSTTADMPRPAVITWQHDGLYPVAQSEHLGQPDAPQEAVDRRFFAIVTDLSGAPTRLLDEHGTVAWRARSTLWGSTAWARGGTAYTPVRFPGQYHDSETGLHYNLNRYYDPETARYTTPDPLGLGPAPNPAGYVPDPTVQSDPLGLAPCGSGTAIDFMNGADNAIPAGNPVTHGPNGTLIGNDPASVRNFQNVRNEGRHDVVAHGSRDGFLAMPEGNVNGGQISDAIRNNPNYDGGDLRLMVCHSGSDTSGIAQDLANELGVTVKAPTDMVGTQPALGPGQTPRIANNGSWRIFLPIVAG